MRYVTTIGLFLSLAAALCAETMDSLVFTNPLSATGYSGTGVRTMGENLPQWFPPSDVNKGKKNLQESGSMLTVGWAPKGFDLYFLSYPDKIITGATSFGYRHENPTTRLIRQLAVPDSLLDSLALAYLPMTPGAVNQKTTLDHIRVGQEFRLNIWPFLKEADFLPFPINPYCGVGSGIDISFGSTKVSPVYAPGQPAIPDTLFSGFDTTVNRFNFDITVSFPIGLEIYPFKKTDIFFIKDIGISFAYVFSHSFRTLAIPDKDLNPYKDFLDQLKNNSNNNGGNNGSGTGTGTGTNGNNNSSSNDKKGPQVWTGWSPLGSNNEFRVSLELKL